MEKKNHKILPPPTVYFLNTFRKLKNWRQYALCPVNWLCAHLPLYTHLKRDNFAHFIVHELSCGVRKKKGEEGWYSWTSYGKWRQTTHTSLVTKEKKNIRLPTLCPRQCVVWQWQHFESRWAFSLSSIMPWNFVSVYVTWKKETIDLLKKAFPKVLRMNWQSDITKEHGWESAESLPQDGKGKTLFNKVNINTMSIVIEEDCHLMIKLISEWLPIPRRLVQCFLMKELDMKRVCTASVPHFLHTHEMECHWELCCTNLTPTVLYKPHADCGWSWIPVESHHSKWEPGPASRPKDENWVANMTVFLSAVCEKAPAVEIGG